MTQRVKSIRSNHSVHASKGDERIRTAGRAPSTDSAYDRLSWFIGEEKAGNTEHWQYDPRPDIERLLLAFSYLHDSALLVQNGCDTGHLDLGLEAATKALERVAA